MRRLATLFLVLGSLPAQAAVQLDAQTRDAFFSSLATDMELFCATPQSCSVLSQTQTPDADSDAAAGFEPFDADLSSSLFASVAVSQSSTTEPGRLRATASHAAVGSASLGSGSTPGHFFQSTVQHDTGSLFRVDFTLDAPTSYRLDAAIEAMGGGFIGETGVHVELRRSTGEVLHRIALEDDDDCFDPECLDLGTLALDETGTLAAGSYVLEAEVAGWTEALVTAQVQAASSHSGSFDVDLRFAPQVPVPMFAGPLLALMLALLARAAIQSSPVFSSSIGSRVSTTPR